MDGIGGVGGNKAFTKRHRTCTVQSILKRNGK